MNEFVAHSWPSELLRSRLAPVGSVVAQIEHSVAGMASFSRFVLTAIATVRRRRKTAVRVPVSVYGPTSNPGGLDGQASQPNRTARSKPPHPGHDRKPKR